ncbi:MAG TPA: Stp1/IreP family PP2C-type Ser/Thr phosphatase [Gemmatimonadaceae bacterium]|nr:Stp1/IreP family PP2C-type Ser/Thr phosphatase [Gemmatimonadaceae bacterium]
MELAVAARSDVGMIRAGNEDNFYATADERGGIFVVADGMGGHAAGEVASEMAVKLLRDQLAALRDLHDRRAGDRVLDALRAANLAIYNRTVTEIDKQGMGTTASVLIIAGRRYLIGQVGDSRVYLLRDGALRQLTKDHSYVQEQVDAGFLTPEQARYHPYSNVITRCVGASDDVEPDTFAGETKVGDIFLVASDGLTGMVDDRRLQQLLQARVEPARIVDSLIAEANGRGGLDNITAIVVSVRVLDADPHLDAQTVEAPAYRPHDE